MIWCQRSIDARTDWRGGDGIAFVIADDIVIATPGLGEGIFLAEAAGLTNGLGTIIRQYSHFDGENREFLAQYKCTISAAGSETINLIARNVMTEKRAEACVPVTGGGKAFVNSFWISADDGLVWQSDQRTSDDIGQVVVQHIKR